VKSGPRSRETRGIKPFSPLVAVEKLGNTCSKATIALTATARGRRPTPPRWRPTTAPC
jgi:hypothetical protein